MAEDNRFTIKIITPDRVFYEGLATMVEFNTTEGSVCCFHILFPSFSVLF